MGKSQLNGLTSELSLIADSSLVPRTHVQTALVEGWNTAVRILLENRLPTREEEDCFYNYLDYFSVDPSKGLDAGWSLIQGSALRDVLEGNLPDTSYYKNLPFYNDLPFNFQKSESLVWAFPQVPYYERRTKRIRQGMSHGVSIRVMKGLYYSPRIFQSETIEKNETKLIDVGVVAVTDKHIYFSGQEKSFRVPYVKIVSFDGYSEGFSIVRDAASARPQIFETGDGWFSYNLVANLAKRKS